VLDSPIVKSSISKQIAEQLRHTIVNGRFKIGERLPSESELLVEATDDLMKYLLDQFEPASQR